MFESLKQTLVRRQKVCLADPTRLKSAVLLPVYIKNGAYHILFIKRTEFVRVHKGQISFPGGTYEPRDLTLVTTALRESWEEVGLRPEHVEVLGELDDTFSVTSGYIISPFVGRVPWPYQLTVDGHETESIIEVPVMTLLEKLNLPEEVRILDQRPVQSYFYDYQGKVIWGATARILNQFLHVFSEALPKS